MFDNKPKPFRGPPGAVHTYEVGSPKGRKSFKTPIAAQSYAKEQRDEDRGWAEVFHCIRSIIEKRS